MVATNVSASRDALTEMHPSLRCTQSLPDETFFTKGLYTFLSGDFKLLSEMGEFVHGLFKSWLYSTYVASFSGGFPIAVNSQQSQIVGHSSQLC